MARHPTNHNAGRLGDVKRIARSFLRLLDDEYIDFCLAVYVANRFDSIPLWAMLVSAPSNGKTEILRAFRYHPAVFYLSDLTNVTFASGYKRDKKSSDPSLLNRLTGITLVVNPDLTTLIQRRDTVKSEIYGQMRAIYDGDFCKSFGTGDDVAWEGRFGFLTGVTGAVDKELALNQTLGERFILYRITDVDNQGMADTALESGSGEKARKKALRVAVHDFLDVFGDGEFIPETAVLPADKGKEVKALALFCTKGRTGVIRDRFTRVVEARPQSEGPGRVTKQLRSLAVALAMVRGLSEVDDGVMEIVAKVALDTMPTLRCDLLNALWKSSFEDHTRFLSARKVGAMVRLPETTVKRHLEDLVMLGLVDRIDVNDVFRCQLSETGVDLFLNGGLF
jgi:hypothetical protein